VTAKHGMSEKFQGVLFDIDGVLEFQGKAYPGAVELLEVLSTYLLKSHHVCEGFI